MADMMNGHVAFVRM